MEMQFFSEYADKVVRSCSRVIVGKEKEIRLVLTAFLCSGHVLLEDIPGTGKTMLLRSFAKTVGGEFRRIQFTPDLLPSDLTGINFYNQKLGEFVFRKGPLFSQLVLADEINRATPRTQSSLLEAMEERQITVDGTTYPLGEPFFVMATQNPVESYGTFPLPEAQTDRFFLCISLGYMNRSQEIEVLSRPDSARILDELTQAVTPEETAWIKEHYREVSVSPVVQNYLMDLIEATRKDKRFILGASTRGALALYKSAQMTAALSGRDYVIPEDVKAMLPHVLCHRLGSRSGRIADVREQLVRLGDTVPVPTETLS